MLAKIKPRRFAAVFQCATLLIILSSLFSIHQSESLGCRSNGSASKSVSRSFGWNRAATDALTRRFVAATLPAPLTAITESSPLFFLHQRKSAGSSLRASFKERAKQLGLTVFIPCHNGTACDIYTISSNQAAVYAGHFPFHDTQNLLRHTGPLPVDAPQRPNFSCITIFRDPIERLQSCFYYRFVQNYRGYPENFKCLNDVSKEMMRGVFRNRRDIHSGNGCLDEPFRIFSGISDEELLSAANELSSPLFALSFERTLDNLSKCVVVILEEQGTFEAAAEWMPQFSSALLNMSRLNEGTLSKCKPTERTLGILNELAEGEKLLYAAARERAQVFVSAAMKKTFD